MNLDINPSLAVVQKTLKKFIAQRKDIDYGKTDFQGCVVVA